ncbi:DUF2213 domain-containing protein [Acetobacter sp. TBRC 12305]|uniref:DUF2213 domain-containing protein n=1 Tax=Acetobacter garciniae TaxID=2817435 RepID=A0A939HM51_9PROT|nr:DUF2213 domain-containing protein [Acetobacter garciniae]MBO1326057.1 DUF2213 domain-containing protein [Acetobacter garciniae]MBX0345199.1 DUF2213 domain-containing protein [Acetobacter garciniae]
MVEQVFSLALDRAGSVRLTDEDGRLHVARTPISKAAVNSYYGREIPGFAELGLDPDRPYRLLRDPAELAKAADSFNALPVLAEHAHVTAHAPRPDLVVGATGTAAAFAPPYLTNALTIWNANAIEGIRSGAQRELSCAYRYVPVMEPGEHDGQPYDGRMTQIRGNHVALVRAGRAGPDVLVADEKPKENAMDVSPPAARAAATDPAIGKGAARTAGQAFALLGTAIASGRLSLTAPVADLRACLDRFDPKGEGTQGCAESADSPHAGTSRDTDEQGHARTGAQARTQAKGSSAPANAGQETERPELAGDSAVRVAVDAALRAERERTTQLAEALALARPLVGEVLGMDSAEDILRYALQERGVDTQGVNLPGLKALALAQGTSALCGAASGSGPQGGVAADSAAAARASALATRYGVATPRKF